MFGWLIAVALGCLALVLHLEGAALGAVLRIFEVAVLHHVFDQCVDARFDAIEQRLRVHTGEHDRCDERQQHQAFLDTQFRELRVVLVRLAVEDTLVGPEQVERSEDHAGSCHDGPPPCGLE